MGADFVAVRLNQLGLSGTQRDPLAALVMCGPFRVDHAFIGGRQIVGGGEFVDLDIEALLAAHAAVMSRLYKQ